MMLRASTRGLQVLAVAWVVLQSVAALVLPAVPALLWWRGSYSWGILAMAPMLLLILWSPRYYQTVVVDSKSWTVPERDRLAHLMTVADEKADAVVKTLGFRPQPSVWLTNSSSSVAKSFLDEVNLIPSWVDLEKLRRGCAFYRENVLFMSVGQAIGLIESYSFPDDAKVLALAGGLTTSEARSQRRLIDTLLFVRQLTALECGPLPGTPGHDAALAVRLMHAHVRHRVAGQWTDTRTVPVNQATMCGTLLLFCHVPVEHMRKCGLLVARREMEDYWHLWRYVGYLIGVKEEILPPTYEDGLRARASEAYLGRMAPDETSRAIVTRTLMALRSLPGAIPDGLMRCNLRMFLGAELCGGLGIADPGATWWNLYAARTFVLRRVRWLHVHVPWLCKLQAQLLGTYLDAVVADVQQSLRS